jgi:hypothetical protein
LKLNKDDKINENEQAMHVHKDTPDAHKHVPTELTDTHTAVACQSTSSMLTHERETISMPVTPAIKTKKKSIDTVISFKELLNKLDN